MIGGRCRNQWMTKRSCHFPNSIAMNASEVSNEAAADRLRFETWNYSVGLCSNLVSCAINEINECCRFSFELYFSNNKPAFVPELVSFALNFFPSLVLSKASVVEGRSAASTFATAPLSLVYLFSSFCTAKENFSKFKFNFIDFSTYNSDSRLKECQTRWKDPAVAVLSACDCLARPERDEFPQLSSISSSPLGAQFYDSGSA